MDDWLPIVQLLEEQEELAASMMSEFPTSLAWLDDEATEHPISIVDFRAALREQIADDETQVFAEGFMEGFAPLAECRALLGISAAMGANEGEDDDEGEREDVHEKDPKDPPVGEGVSFIPDEVGKLAEVLLAVSEAEGGEDPVEEGDLEGGGTTITPDVAMETDSPGGVPDPNDGMGALQRVLEGPPG